MTDNSSISIFQILLSFRSPRQLRNGAEEDRTPDPLLAKQVLSQLSYSPKMQVNIGGPSRQNHSILVDEPHQICPANLVGPRGFEPLTPSLSGTCSNQLSYGPKSRNEVSGQ